MSEKLSMVFFIFLHVCLPTKLILKMYGSRLKDLVFASAICSFVTSFNSKNLTDCIFNQVILGCWKVHYTRTLADEALYYSTIYTNSRDLKLKTKSYSVQPRLPLAATIGPAAQSFLLEFVPLPDRRALCQQLI